MNEQWTIYCGKPHRTADGVPIGHACRVLPREYLEAERREEYGRAVDVLERAPLVLHVPATASGSGRVTAAPASAGERF